MTDKYSVMRQYINLIESLLLESHFNPSAIYLHGGPAELAGGHFARKARGRDMGGIFFIEESPTGWRYALGYAMKYTKGAVYRCRITAPADRIFDFTNPKHRAALEGHVPDEVLARWTTNANGGPLHWKDHQPADTMAALQGENPVVTEEVLTQLGFVGAVLLERAKGGHLPDNAVSITIYDPAHIEIIDAIDKREALQKYGR